jgi:hypothetical protein
MMVSVIMMVSVETPGTLALVSLLSLGAVTKLLISSSSNRNDGRLIRGVE